MCNDFIRCRALTEEIEIRIPGMSDVIIKFCRPDFILHAQKYQKTPKDKHHGI